MVRYCCAAHKAADADALLKAAVAAVSDLSHEDLEAAQGIN